MGMNLLSCCHRCKEKIFHFRGRENETLLPFYRKHYECMKLDPANVETLEEEVQERDWMWNGEYKDCSLKGYFETLMIKEKIESLKNKPEKIVIAKPAAEINYCSHCGKKLKEKTALRNKSEDEELVQEIRKILRNVDVGKKKIIRTSLNSNEYVVETIICGDKIDLKGFVISEK